MTVAVERLLTKHLDTWTAAVEPKSAAGRGSSKKLNLVGIKKLRELILELAVRGQLVPQDENDEPAEVLLSRIAAERERLVKEKKIKKPKVLPEVSEDEKPFDLPEGWAWSRLSDCAYVFSGTSFQSKDFNKDGGVRVIKITNAGVGEIVPTNDYLPDGFSEKYESFKVFTGDIILALTRPYIAEGLKISICPEEYNGALLNQRVAAIRTFLKLDFLYQFLSSTVVLNRYKNRFNSSGLQPNLKMGDVTELLIPLPPVEEQKRIASKVDELMALCDALEQEQESSIAAHGLLVENLLAALTNAANQGEFKQAWARVAAHFDTLFTTEQSVEQLKQTILQLAVMGKLVEQDPADESAEVLLGRIAAEKKRLVDEKVIKKQKALPEISEEEKVFELPEGWAWCRFADLANDVATGPFGSMIHKRDYIENGIPLINPSHMINSEIVEDLSISVSSEKAEELNSYTLFTGDIVMARRGEMGRCALVTEREDGWLCGTGSFVLRFQPELSREYVLLFFKTEWTKSYLGGKSIGTTMTNLNHGILNKMPILLPPANEQKRITMQVEALMLICDQLKRRIVKSQASQVTLADALTESSVS